MMTVIQPYIDLIFKERSWSWAVVCLLYLLAALFVRGWFVGPLFQRLKTLEHKTAQSFKSAYLKYSILGWAFFLVPQIFVVLCWRRSALPFPINEVFLLAGGAACFILSIIFHLQAFSLACL